MKCDASSGYILGYTRALPREKSGTDLSQERQRHISESHWLQILPANIFLLQMCQKEKIILEQLK